MSIVENLRRQVAKPMAAADVAAQLATAESNLVALEAEYGSIALDALAGTTGASDRLQELQGQLAAARDRVAATKAAHKAALERDEAVIQGQRAALRKTQIAAMRKHIEARDQHAVALAAAIAEAAKHYHGLLDRSEKAERACPIGSRWPQHDGWAATKRFVINEFYRVSASPGNQDSRALPGSEPSGADTQWNPAAIPPLAERIAKASAGVLETITGKSAA